MTPSGQTLCLCMIVKDEAPVIRRCLDSVRPLVDAWLVVDTGSTDGTQDIARDHMADLPGALVERPWRDFAHNRNEALALAQKRGTYTLVIDADDALVVPEGYRLPGLDADSYTVDIDFDGTRYRRPQVLKASLGWRYEGVIHEYLACEAARTAGQLPLVMRIHRDGARRRDPGTFARDAAVLERAATEETDPFRLARTTFYLAQSYRDAGRAAEAVPLYLRRAGMGFWEEEAFVSLLTAGRLTEEADPEGALALYARAGALCPARAEAAHAASRLCRTLGRFAEGRAAAAGAAGLPQPADGLFVEGWIYRYGLLDELAVNAYWAGDMRACRDGCMAILRLDDLPPADRARVSDNLRFAVQALDTELDAAIVGTPPEG